MAKRVLSTVFLVGVLALANAAQAATPCYGTAEVALTSAASYNASSGSPNPFDLTFTALVTAPSGRKYTVPGFFDGNGAGASIGNVWKFRVYTDEVGTWRWTTSSTVAGLNALSGSAAVSGTLAGMFANGPIVENPTRPRTFMYQSGKPVFLTGKFLDSAASSPIKFSHTMFSEKLTDTNRQAMLSRHLGMKLNKINIYYANKGDYSGVSTTPWVGTATSNDKTRFDLARWRMYDQWIVKLRDSGVAAHMWYFADDSNFSGLSLADRQRLFKYAMARHSAYVNTMFVVALEWQEMLSSTEVVGDANVLHQNNPWARLLSVHGITGNFSFPTALWADYMDIQGGNTASHATIHKSTLSHRSLAVKPIIQEEHGLGTEDTVHRQRAWAAFTGGAAGVGTGAYLKPLVTFTEQVAWERMDPADTLVKSGYAYVLAESGVAYVCYLYNGGSFSVDLTKAIGTLTARWYDPRNGTFLSSATINGGGVRSLTAPSSGDWVLYLRK
jgi:hypothetical protein